MESDVILSAVVTAAVMLAIWMVYLYLRSGGDFAKYRAAQAIAARITRDPDFALRAKALLEPPKPPEPPKPSGAPLRLLAVLQREGRLLDFLLEDIQGCSNEQIAAAVRDIHRSCHKALAEHLVLVPVLQGEEGTPVDVPRGFDPSAVRLTGNVTGQPPFRGTLLHHGWRVKEIKLAKPADGQDEFIVQPAEVELS
jgi:Domain of unknown function (DUF2760)